MILNSWHAGLVPTVVISKFKPGRDTFKPKLPVGPQRLIALVTAFIIAMHPAEKDAMKTYLMDECLEGIDGGTFCSGTDSPVLVWTALLSAIAVALNIVVPFRHRFSAEINEDKQSFLTSAFPSMENLYKDVMDLKHKCAMEIRFQELTEVPEINFGIGGFPCTDASGLNPSSSSVEHRSCVSEGTLRTGSVLNGIVECYKVHGKSIKFTGLENVYSLSNPPRDKDTKEIIGPSNLDATAYIFKTELKHLLHTWLLEPNFFGVPANRRRLWMTTLPEDDLPLPVSEVHAMLDDVMGRLVGFQMNDVNEFLLPDNDGRIVKMLSQLSSCASPGVGPTFTDLFSSDGVLAEDKKLIVRDRSKETWPGKHAAAFAALGEDREFEKLYIRLLIVVSFQSFTFFTLAAVLQQTNTIGCDCIGNHNPTIVFIICVLQFSIYAFETFQDRANYRVPDHEVIAQFPWLRKLSVRQFEMLHLKGVRCFPESLPRIIDVSQQLSFCYTSKDIMQCVTPEGIKYMTHKCRALMGVEALQLQGMYFPRDVTDKFSNDLLSSLAGNAFEASCCAAMIFSSLQVLAKLHVIRRSQPDPARELRGAGSVADDDELESIWDSPKKKLRLRSKTTDPYVLQ
jgi:site-specific DNA-cytosine methylase